MLLSSPLASQHSQNILTSRITRPPLKLHLKAEREGFLSGGTGTNHPILYQGLVPDHLSNVVCVAFPHGTCHI